MRMNLLLILLSLTQLLPAQDAAVNTFVEIKAEIPFPDALAQDKKTRWETTDGFSDSVYRSKTGTLILRTGIHNETLGYSPGYYTNTSVEWNIETQRGAVVDIFNWSGGSYGGGKLLPAFKEHPTPSPRHTYDSICYVDEEDAMYMVLGANWKATAAANADPEAKAAMDIDNKSTWKFSFADKRWTRIDGGVNRAGYSGSPYENHLQYWPGGKKLMFLNDGGNFYAEFDLASQQWTRQTLKNKCPMSLYNARSTWDSKRNVWVFRCGPNLCTFDPQAKEFKALPAPYTLEDPKKDPRRALKPIAYHSKLDLYLITGESGEDTWSFNPTENTWKQHKLASPTMPNGYLQYDPRTDTVVLSYQLKIFTLKFVP